MYIARLRINKKSFLSFHPKVNLTVKGDEELKDGWATSRITKGVKVSSHKGIVALSLSNVTDPFYIFHKFRAKEFKRIGFNNGIIAKANEVFNVGIDGQNSEKLHCNLYISEFDSVSRALGVIKVPKAQILEYTPSEDCFRFAIFIRFKGDGKYTLNGITFIRRTNGFEPPSLEPAESDLGNYQDTQLSNVTPLNENSLFTFEEDKLLVPLNEVNRRMTEISSAHSRELYKWKRRANGWKIKVENGQRSSELDLNSTFDIYSKLAQSIPLSNGSKYYSKIQFSVGIIADIHMFNFYKDAFENVHYLSPTNYKEKLASNKLDFIIYCTGWRGLDNEEWRGIKFRNTPKKAFEGIIEHGRTHGIKLVFQSTEDPSNFDYFLPIAKNFDYIFTTAKECIDDYISACGHNNVFYGEYGISPKFNNPIGSRRISLDYCFFAGSWAARYQERCDDTEMIFDSIVDSNRKLFIADRNYKTSNKDHIFPDRFSNLLLPKFEHELLQSLHKLFRVSINLNSIKNSVSMCAMRVYQFQAMGLGVISNYSKSVFNNFPEIRILTSKIDLSDGQYDKNEILLQDFRQKMRGVRRIFKDKTVFDSGHNLINKIGLTHQATVEPTICVIYSEEGFPLIEKSFNEQEYGKKILVNQNDINTKNKWKNFIKREDISYFTWFSGKDEYEKFYLTDLINGFKYTNSDFITKLSFYNKMGDFIEGIQHDYTDHFTSKFRTLFSCDSFLLSDVLEYSNSDSSSITSTKGYSIDPFEMNYLKSRETLYSNKPNTPYRLSVIVPVFNNGRFLINKCFNSLLRNKSFCEMEILLIDDASTENETLYILETLEREYSNVRLFKFSGSPSGSASSPRNKGLEIAKSKLVTYLDPDNEISPSGYDNLLSIYEKCDYTVPIVTGYHLKVGEEVKIIAKHTHDELKVVENPKQKYLERGKFPVLPTQPAVIEAEFLRQNNINFVEKAVGQDTLFGWEIIANAPKIAFTSSAHLIYYSERVSSVVNAIDSDYFSKKYLIEKEQVSFLENNNIINCFLENHYNHFMDNWYLKKLELVTCDQEKRKCIDIIKDIASLYGDSNISKKLLDLGL